MLRRREMEMTADLVRIRIAQAAPLRPLADAGRPARFCYDEQGVRLESADRVIARFVWREWYRPSLETREDRAAEVAYHLIIEAISSGPIAG